MTNSICGISGGGQLARMLALAGAPLGLTVRVLTAQADDPAAQVCGQTHLGSLMDVADLKWFFADLNLATFESEFVDTERLQTVVPPSCFVFPSLDAVATIQDRLSQKQLLNEFKIPTAPWISVSKSSDLELAQNKFSKGFVLKQRRFGYDGYGTFVYKLNAKVDASVLQKSQSGFIAESFVDFKRELATSFVRSRSGEFLALPLVESKQVNARCFSVHGPISNKKINQRIKQFQRLMNEMNYVGILTVELFETSKGELLVNELAPRVHNSAHYSQNALTCSQFEYHWRAGLDWPLPKVQRLSPAFAMVNLLGEGHDKVKLSHSPIGALHWYGKSENHYGRKLGHINVLGKTPQQALKQALNWRKDFKL